MSQRASLAPGRYPRYVNLSRNDIPVRDKLD